MNGQDETAVGVRLIGWSSVEGLTLMVGGTTARFGSVEEATNLLNLALEAEAVRFLDAAEIVFGAASFLPAGSRIPVEE